MQYLLLLGQPIIRFLFLSRHISPKAAKFLINCSRLLDIALPHYFWSLLLHKNHKCIQRLLNVFAIITTVIITAAVIIIITATSIIITISYDSMIVVISIIGLLVII